MEKSRAIRASMEMCGTIFVSMNPNHAKLVNGTVIRSEATMNQSIKRRNKKMTKDTERTLAACEGIARVLHISLDADEFWLYCNGQKIGISCNSTYATVKEFIGYAMLEISRRSDCSYKVPASLEKQIKEYWR